MGSGEEEAGECGGGGPSEVVGDSDEGVPLHGRWEGQTFGRGEPRAKTGTAGFVGVVRRDVLGTERARW